MKEKIKKQYFCTENRWKNKNQYVRTKKIAEVCLFFGTYEFHQMAGTDL